MFRNSDAEADYYRRFAGERATVASAPTLARPSFEADEGGEVQPARPGAVAESFALDWTGVQDSSLGFRFLGKGFMEKIFTDDRPSPPVLKANVPPVLPDRPAGVVAQPKAPAWNLKIGVSASSQCILCKADVPYEHRRRATLQRVSGSFTFSSRAREDAQAYHLSRKGGSEEELCQLCDSLEACMGLKSCFTVEKRANSLPVFVRWFQVHPPPREFLSEESMWNFFSQVKCEGAPKSKRSGIVSALRFLHHVVRVACPTLVDSRRLSGLADALSNDGQPRLQASELTVEQVRHLRNLLESEGTDPLDRYCLAYLLIALCGRAHHSDLCCVFSGLKNFDGMRGFLEFSLGVTRPPRRFGQKSTATAANPSCFSGGEAVLASSLSGF